MSTTTTLTPKGSVGRPRLYDEETVLESLTSLFWRQGYTQTSMADIVEASGVHKPSLYRTFGSKEELFATVLRRYLAERIAMFAATIESAGEGVAAVHAFLEAFEGDALSERGRDGCLMVMASNELRGQLPGYDFATDYRRQMRAQLGVLVSRATDPADEQLVGSRADLLTTCLLGVQVILRSGAGADDVHRYLAALHDTVDTW